ncbi:MAG TPA: hypothetical protein VNQ78_06970 [Paracoccus sp. (in: a-proteobacteria)]|uniref:hypothetical protein n=1 Tax=Paracoccus sp. TaxID=267 RepID=UPI002BBFBACF|nr:hypothetical protein [Paracoccus sp. (in: a-proteobacteria)]HWL56407.1 hypothetical protein [Paracoccus sp. (in: a-proteobacteria)]
MLYPTAGSRLYIADAPAEVPGAFPASGWVEVAEPEALGVLGVEWEAVEVSDMAIGEVGTLKGVLRRQPMQIILGDDPADPGQALIWAASRSSLSYPFRLVLPGGVLTRRWFGLVMAIGEVFDAANSVIRTEVTLQPTSQITRSEAS